MEYLEGGSLKELIKEKWFLNERETQIIMKQLFDGVYYLSQRELVHWDLKLDNVVIANKETLQVKIVDLGILGLKN